MGSGGGLRRERQGRTSHGLQSLATAERRKASTVLYCLSLHTSYPTPAGDPGAHPNWRPTRTGQLSMRSHACPCLLSMFTWLKFGAFEKVFLRVAPCRILRGTLTGIRQTRPPFSAQAGTPRERQCGGDWTPQKNSG